MDKIKKPFYKKWWVWVIAVVIIIAVASNQDGDKTTTASAPTTTSTVTKSSTASAPSESSVAATSSTAAETTMEEVVKEKPMVDFSKMDITVDNVKTAIKDVVEADKLKNVQVTTKKGKTAVDVYFDPGMVWDEKDLVNQTAKKATDTMEILFKNPKVDKIWFGATTKMTDAKGNEADENVVNVCLTKENAKDINWPKFKEMVLLDYKNLFNIADSSFIYPSIKSKLE